MPNPPTSKNFGYKQRQAGVVLHITSLPQESSQTAGCLDQNAWRFIDWMERAQLKIWQMLPLNAPHDDLSPYSALSAFAMNPRFLPAGWKSDFEKEFEGSTDAFETYLNSPPHWLEDFALFMALREHFEHRAWNEWPEAYKYRDSSALEIFKAAHQIQLLEIKQQQFWLSHLWQALKTYANQKAITLFGDMPIFIAYDSADVWANPENFKLDQSLNPTVVAGVPPDYFSETGQRWGNPHYDWEKMEKDNFSWWHLRIEHALSQLDVLRIDHFRGLEASWEIQADEETAMNGVWEKVPGERLLQSLQQSMPNMPLVAEDLGIITPEVVALKEAFDLPGMAVLQFGFNGLPDNPHALDEQVENSVVYSGTHDNDTTMGWFESLEPGAQNWVWSQLESTHKELEQVGVDVQMPWPLIMAGLKSVPNWFIAPMQDWLALGTESRMNTPGTIENNWSWQLQEGQLTEELADKIATLIQSTGRS